MHDNEKKKAQPMCGISLTKMSPARVKRCCIVCSITFHFQEDNHLPSSLMCWRFLFVLMLKRIVNNDSVRAVFTEEKQSVIHCQLSLSILTLLHQNDLLIFKFSVVLMLLKSATDKSTITRSSS